MTTQPGQQPVGAAAAGPAAGPVVWAAGKPLSAAMPPEIRGGFLRKVYGLLASQLALTAAIGTALSVLATPAWIQGHLGLFYLASFGALALLLGTACCCPSAMRSFPSNYLFLLTFTLLEAVTVGFVGTLYTGPSLLIAAASTAGVFFCLTAYACLTKTDFTGMGPYLWAACLSLLCFSLVKAVWSHFAPVPTGLLMLYPALGVVLFSLYIVYDTQLIVGGAHRQHEFGPDDSCLAALSLYLDLVNMFLCLLDLFGDRR